MPDQDYQEILVDQCQPLPQDEHGATRSERFMHLSVDEQVRYEGNGENIGPSRASLCTKQSSPKDYDLPPPASIKGRHDTSTRCRYLKDVPYRAFSRRHAVLRGKVPPRSLGRFVLAPGPIGRPTRAPPSDRASYLTVLALRMEEEKSFAFAYAYARLTGVRT